MANSPLLPRDKKQLQYTNIQLLTDEQESTSLLAVEQQETKHQSTSRTTNNAPQSNPAGASAMNTVDVWEETKIADLVDALKALADDHVLKEFFNLFDVSRDKEITVKELIATLHDQSMDRELDATEVILAALFTTRVAEKKYITFEDVKNEIAPIADLMREIDINKFSDDELKSCLAPFAKLPKMWPKMRRAIINDPEKLHRVIFNTPETDSYYIILITFRLSELEAMYDSGEVRCQVNIDGTLHYGYAYVKDTKQEFEQVLVGMHRIFCVDRVPKTISLKLGEEEEIIIPYNKIDSWSEEKTTCEDIKESKSYKTDAYQIYQEYVGIICASSALETLNEEQCNVYSDRKQGKKAYMSALAGKVSVDDMESSDYCNWYKYKYPVPHDSKRYQFYYCKATKTAYCVHNDTIQASNVYSQQGSSLRFAYNYNAYKRDLDDLGDFESLLSLQIFLYQNITPPIWIASRYNFIKECCLYGQDNEFNIFRSICFMKPKSDTEKMKRFAIAVICLLFQICLTIGIVTDVNANWEMLENQDRGESGDIIIAISVFSFSFISFSFLFTVRKFLQFYISMHEVCVVSWIIVCFDFISNILIGFIIVVSSLFFLLQSQTVIDTVLHSFALIFVIRVDDFINLFESNEKVLIQNDWNHYKDNSDWDFDEGKRKIDVIPRGCCEWMSLFVNVVISPLYSIWALMHFICGSVVLCKKKREKKGEKWVPINTFGASYANKSQIKFIYD